MDTLVYSSSLFLIPANIAAMNGQYVLMNTLIGLSLTSWAHHSNWQVCPGRTVYCELDNVMCYFTIYYTFMYAILYSSRWQCALYMVCLSCVFYSYYNVNKNENYDKRGLSNWRYHKYHILMHVSACIGMTIIALQGF